MAPLNPKASAWDQIGGLFWTQGRVSARPSQSELDEFCSGIEPNQKVCVIGASTKELCEEVISLDAQLTVIDFSQKMIQDLSLVLNEGDLRVLDITAEIPADLDARFDFVLSDRLINRFDHEEARRGVEGMSNLLLSGGIMRTSVKLGLYPMDRTMLSHAAEADCVDDFWDEATQTIDFSRAGASLEAGLLPHGSIDKILLKDWYKGRGREKRFTEQEIETLLKEAHFEDIQASIFPDASETKMFMGIRV